jgi:glycosyltransferase involved in cell wall biosynthesis
MEAPLRILWLEPETHVPGGGPRSSLALAAALRRDGHDVEMVDALPWGEWPSIVQGLSDKKRWDVVFSQQFSAQPAQAFADMCGVPYVHFLHGPGQVAIAPRADLYVANTFELLYASAYEMREEARTPSAVVHPHVMASMRGKPSVRRSVILTIGSGVHKGLLTVAQAAKHLPDEIFLIATQNAPPQDVPENVLWMGATTEPEKLFSVAKLFVLPSTVESYGLVYAEAAAWRLPIIACDLPGPREALFHQASFVPVTVTGEELAKAIGAIMKNDIPLETIDRETGDLNQLIERREETDRHEFVLTLRRLLERKART